MLEQNKKWFSFPVWRNKAYIILMVFSMLIFLTIFWISLHVTIEPIAVSITELSACDETGQAKSKFSPDEERIFVCGNLKTLQPADIIIHWYYENELVFQQIGTNIEGRFYNYIEPNQLNSFPIGSYRIKILVGDVVVKETRFAVK